MALRRTAGDRARFVLHDIRNFIGRVYEGAAEANVPFLASGLTFDALLALVPLIFLLLSVAGYVLSAEAGRAQLAIDEYLRRFLPATHGGESPFAPVLDLAARIVEGRQTLGLLGVPLFVWFSTRLFGSLRTVLNEVFDTEDRRGWIRGKIQDIGLVLVVTMLFVVNTALSEGLEILAALDVFQQFGYLEYFAAQLLAFVAVVTVFVVVFRYAPAHRVRRDTALFAGFICAFGFEIAKILLGLYVETFVKPARLVSDATLAALLLFVLWTYYMAYVFLIGGTIAQVYELRRRQATRRVRLRPGAGGQDPEALGQGPAAGG